jgi:glutathione S-transferase
MNPHLQQLHPYPFEKLATLLPKDSLTQQTLGWLYFIQRDFPRAIQHLEIALHFHQYQKLG